MRIRYLIKPNQYFDSVSLMTIARDVQNLPGVEDAALVMGTEANKRLLTQIGTLSDEVLAASATDLILMVKGEADKLDHALVSAEKLLTGHARTTIESNTYRPRTLRSAVRANPDSKLAVISVAGNYATAEAWTALHQGLHVLLFSDNVSLADEIVLKKYAVEHDLLLMGPGAGTTILNGVALGFANALLPGSVGIVSAAGTGLQEVSSLLTRYGTGISQGIGVGGRDLSDEVGGMMMLHALDALQMDSQTQVLVAISKLPSPAVAQKILAKLESSDKPAVVIFMGADDNFMSQSPHVHIAHTLQEAALMASALAQRKSVADIPNQLAMQTGKLQEEAQTWIQKLASQQKYVRGLFSGGTLCEEALQIWSRYIGDVHSNAPLKPELQIADFSDYHGHGALDLGDEAFTVGRPHPMIDNDLRIRFLKQEADKPEVAVIQMDVVLGYGAHPDPAGELAPVIRQVREKALAEGHEMQRELLIVIAVTGTASDPQNYDNQVAAFESAGALVLNSNAEASQLTAFIVSALT